MEQEKRNELRKLFRLIFATKLSPEKYSKVESYEELESLLEKNKEDKKAVEQALESYTDEELLEIAAQLEAEQVPKDKKGGKVNYLGKLQKYKKGKKCKCGCDLVFSKEKGGKVTQKCACGCKM